MALKEAPFGQNIVRGVYMRKVIRIFDIILAGVCAVLMGLIAVGNGMLPDSIVTYDGNEIPFSAIYSYADTTVSDARWVDSQSANPRRRTVRLFGVVPVKDGYQSGNSAGVCQRTALWYKALYRRGYCGGYTGYRYRYQAGQPCQGRRYRGRRYYCGDKRHKGVFLRSGAGDTE